MASRISNTDAVAFAVRRDGESSDSEAEGREPAGLIFTNNLYARFTPASRHEKKRLSKPIFSTGVQSGGAAKSALFRHPPEDEDRVYYLVFVFFGVLGVILLAMTVVVAVGAGSSGSKPAGGLASHRKLPSGAEVGQFCLPCDQVYLGPFEVQRNRFKLATTLHREDSDVTLCCEHARSDLKHFVQTMYMRVRYQTDRANDSIKFSNGTEEVPAPRPKQNVKLPVRTARAWQDTNKTYLVPMEGSPDADATSVYGVENGKLSVSEGGAYYIYSHLPFKYDRNATVCAQHLYRIRNGGEELLMENSVYPCGAVQKGCTQSFVGGTFLLAAGDRLFLRASGHGCLDQSREAEFGAQRV